MHWEVNKPKSVVAMKKRDNSFILFIVLFLFGIVLCVQIRSTLDALEKKAASAVKLDDLKKRCDEAADDVDRIKALIDEENKKGDNFLEDFAVKSGDSSLIKELETIKLQAGWTDVKGPGLEIVLNDAVRKPGEELLADYDPNKKIIHDSDIMETLNELKKAGAQAISINGERIITASQPVCTGPTIKINNTRHAVPYTIKAIGNPDAMYDGLSNSRVVQIGRIYGKQIDITKSNEVIVSGYKGNLKYLISGLEVVENEVR